uniref:30S ribosomal protein S15 n=1 Tax=Pinguiococcus pyrenoidosus TaxID=172671 RepID=A0A7R9YE60_9STRA
MARTAQLGVYVLLLTGCAAFTAPRLTVGRVNSAAWKRFSTPEGPGAAGEQPEAAAPVAVADPLAGLPDGLDIDGLFGDELEMLSPLEDEVEELFTAEEIEAMEPLDDGKTPVSDAPPGWIRNKMAVTETSSKYKRHETDSGSAEFQVATMTERIKYLTEHARRHPKDNHSRRGLIALVSKRKRLLNYLTKEKPEVVEPLCKDLGIRFKPAGRIMTRAEKYSAFKARK